MAERKLSKMEEAMLKAKAMITVINNTSSQADRDSPKPKMRETDEIRVREMRRLPLVMGYRHEYNFDLHRVEMIKINGNVVVHPNGNVHDVGSGLYERVKLSDKYKPLPFRIGRKKEKKPGIKYYILTCNLKS